MSGAALRRRRVSFLGRWTGRTKPGAISFRPTRHTPLGADATLYVPALDPGPAGSEDEED